MGYSPLRADWFWNLVQVPDLDRITAELLDLRDAGLIGIKLNQFYVNFNSADVLRGCPELKSYLESACIGDILERALFSTDNQAAPIHVDTYDPKYCQMALNFPLKDCAESYLVFYSSKTKDLIPANAVNPSLARETNFAVCRACDANEIARLEYLQPALVNTSVLHKGIAQSASRVIVSLRFTRPLTPAEAIALGCIGEPFVQG